ncbi:MAG: hypothetical protein Q8P17_05250 [bacterium]|nr:hypothetical protein [bacterium]
MRKSELNALFRSYVQDHLSPTGPERELVSDVYESIQNLLGAANCLQIGSFPRFTAITPLHDLDVLCILGPWSATAFDPSAALDALHSNLESEYENPRQYDLEISQQTHSVTLQFSDGGDEVFSVDIVPAYVSGKNEFGEDMYMVPEIATKSHRERKRIATEVSKGTHKMAWIKSDPRGYITTATRENQSNDDFRKSVKLMKGWRASCKDTWNENFPIKSFHLEQAMTRSFQKNPDMEIFDAIFNFFCNLPRLIERAHIPDRADPKTNIDAYVENLTVEERVLITQARDFFLIKLEEISAGADIVDLLEAGTRERASNTESYLFDSKIPMLTEQEFSIAGKVLVRNGGFMETILDAVGLIEIDRRIEFRLGRNAPAADIYKWKVKNDDRCEEPRGEITDHQTQRDPEGTKYNGHHFVECFAITNGVCIGRSRQNVVLRRVLG